MRQVISTIADPLSVDAFQNLLSSSVHFHVSSGLKICVWEEVPVVEDCAGTPFSIPSVVIEGQLSTVVKFFADETITEGKK